MSIQTKVVVLTIATFLINTAITLAVLGGLGYVAYHFLHKIW